jgi:hypothetical protein
MKTAYAIAALVALVGLLHFSPAPQVSAVATASAAESCPAFLNQAYRKLHSSDSVNLCTLVAGKPMLIVNTASHCGYTPQFKGLQAAYENYKARGLVVVGFASDDFNQEAKDEAEAATMCYINYRRPTRCSRSSRGRAGSRNGISTSTSSRPTAKLRSTSTAQ